MGGEGGWQRGRQAEGRVCGWGWPAEGFLFTFFCVLESIV